MGYYLDEIRRLSSSFWCCGGVKYLYRRLRFRFLLFKGRRLLYRQTGQLPFREPVFQAPGLEAFCPELGYGFISQYAIGSAAVRHDLLIMRQALELLLQLLERNVERTGQMPRREFLFGANIQYGH